MPPFSPAAFVATATDFAVANLTPKNKFQNSRLLALRSLKNRALVVLGVSGFNELTTKRSTMQLDVEKEVAALQQRPTGQLCERYAELFGEQTRSRHRT